MEGGREGKREEGKEGRRKEEGERAGKSDITANVGEEAEKLEPSSIAGGNANRCR